MSPIIMNYLSLVLVFITNELVSRYFNKLIANTGSYQTAEFYLFSFDGKKVMNTKH